MTSALKRIKRSKIDQMLGTLGIEIKEVSSELDHFMISDRLRKKSVNLAATAITRFLHAAGHSPDARQLGDAVLAFYDLAPRCPVRQSSGGCGFNAGLELFVTARLLAPSLVI